MTLRITTPAASRALLPIESLRTLAGVTDGAQDVELTAFGVRLADSIASACKVVGDGVHIPTLLSEVAEETFRRVQTDRIVLSRRFVSAIASVVVDDVTLDAEEYEVSAESGLLVRLDGGVAVGWCADKVVVTYTAGLLEVPGDLQQAAMDLWRYRTFDASRDPMVRGYREKVDDIREVETTYWVNAASSTAIGQVPDLVLGHLGRYINIAIG